MKHSVLISLLAALVLIMSFPFAVHGKDDYETPIIPVVTTTQVTHTTPESTTTQPAAEPTTVDPADEDPTEPASESGILGLLLGLLRSIVSFFRWIFSLIGGLFA